MQNKEVLKQKIVFIGGHLTPAVAILQELKKRGYKNISWIGTKHTQIGDKNLSAEYQVITNLNIKFYNLTTGKLFRKWSKKTFINGIKHLLRIPIGIINALILVITIRPKMIVSFGGYLSVFPIIFGRLFGSKIVCHEQTLVPGLANKVAFIFASKILLSWENTKINKKFLKKSKIVGNPIRKEVFISKSTTLTQEFDKKNPILLIFCGNQGSHEINKKIFEILDKLLEKVNIIHQTGGSTITQDYQKAINIKNNLPYTKKTKYIVRDYIMPNEIGEALTTSHLIVGRSGANNVTEILALGKLSILIPIPWTSGNEQLLNARMVESTGLGHIIEQDENFTSNKLYEKILFGLENLKFNRGFNTKKLDECRENARKLVNLSAHTEITNIIESLINK